MCVKVRQQRKMVEKKGARLFVLLPGSQGGEEIV